MIHGSQTFPTCCMDFPPKQQPSFSCTKRHLATFPPNDTGVYGTGSLSSFTTPKAKSTFLSRARGRTFLFWPGRIGWLDPWLITRVLTPKPHTATVLSFLFLQFLHTHQVPGPETTGSQPLSWRSTALVTTSVGPPITLAVNLCQCLCLSP